MSPSGAARPSCSISTAVAVRAVGLSAQTVRMVARRYQQGGVAATIYEQPRTGPKEILSPATKQRLIAMVCSRPPNGSERWTTPLVAGEAIQRKGRPKSAARRFAHCCIPTTSNRREKKAVHRGVDAGVRRADGGRVETLCAADRSA